MQVKLALLIIIALFVPLPALAKDITVTLTDDEQLLVNQSLDAWLRSQGLPQNMRVAIFQQKLQAALIPPTETRSVAEPKK